MKAGVDYPGCGVGAMIFNRHGRVLLVKRSLDARNEAGCWDIPGGEVEHMEAREEAVRRETLEEVGVEFTITDQLNGIDHFPPTREGEPRQHWITTTYVGDLTGDAEPTICEPDKFTAIGWFSLDELPEPLSTCAVEVFKLYRERQIAAGL